MNLATSKNIPQPIIDRINELDEKLEALSFKTNTLSYLDQIKVQNLKNKIKKIYLKYSSKELKSDIKKLQQDIHKLLDKGDLDVQKYSILDYQLKTKMQEVKKPAMMTILDDVRVKNFQERINKIYSSNEEQ